jgi:hypothetical protein
MQLIDCTISLETSRFIWTTLLRSITFYQLYIIQHLATADWMPSTFEELD